MRNFIAESLVMKQRKSTYIEFHTEKWGWGEEGAQGSALDIPIYPCRVQISVSSNFMSSSTACNTDFTKTMDYYVVCGFSARN